MSSPQPTAVLFHNTPVINAKKYTTMDEASSGLGADTDNTPAQAAKASNEGDMLTRFMKQQDELFYKMIELMKRPFNPAVEAEIGAVEKQLNTVNSQLEIMIMAADTKIADGLNNPKWTNKESKDDSHSNIGHCINTNEMIERQLQSWEVFAFEQRTKSKPIEYLLNTFEKEIVSSRSQVEDVWRQCIHSTVMFESEAWGVETLLKCKTWKEARMACIQRFDFIDTREASRVELFRTRMTGDQSISEYTSKFLNLLLGAQIKKEDKYVVLMYQCSLFEPCRQAISDIVEEKRQEENGYYYSIEEIADIVRNIFGDKPVNQNTRVATFSQSNKRRHDVEESGGPTKKPSIGAFFCAKHGGHRASHNTADCRSTKAATSSTRYML